MRSNLDVSFDSDRPIKVWRSGTGFASFIRQEAETDYSEHQVSLFATPEQIGSIARGLLDADDVQSALTPDVLRLLATIVRYKAPQFILAEAGLYKADAAETVQAHERQSETAYTLRCESCGGAARWDERGPNEPLYAVHETGAFLCDAGDPSSSVCTIDGKRFAIADETALPILADETAQDPENGWPKCYACGHYASYHDQPDHIAVGCTAPVRLGTENCRCLLVADYTSAAFRPRIPEGVEL